MVPIFLVKLFKTSNVDDVIHCQHCFAFVIPSDLWKSEPSCLMVNLIIFVNIVKFLFACLYVRLCLFVRLFVCFFMLSCFSWISDPASPPFRSSNRICQVAQMSWLPISKLSSYGLKHYGANWNTTWHEARVCPLSKMQWVARWCQLLLKLQCHYFIPVGEWSVAMSISVCVFVSPRAYLRNHVSKVTKFSVCIACSHGLTLNWRHCDRLCTSGFVDEVTISYGSLWVLWRHEATAAALLQCSEWDNTGAACVHGVSLRFVLDHCQAKFTMHHCLVKSEILFCCSLLYLLK